MAKKKSTATSVGSTDVIEATIMINPRGRSVAHGTIVTPEGAESLHRDLSDREIAGVKRLILTDWLDLTYQPIPYPGDEL